MFGDLECWTGVEQLFSWQRRWAILSQQPTNLFLCIFQDDTSGVGVDGAVHDLSSKIPCGAWSLGFVIQSLSCVRLATPWTAAGGSSHPLNSPASLTNTAYTAPTGAFALLIRAVTGTLAMGWEERMGWSCVWDGVSRVWWIVRGEAEGKKKNYALKFLMWMTACTVCWVSICWALLRARNKA